MKKILVIGDSCLDKFVYCHCERLCPEAPVPVLDIIKESSNAGMAGNVVRNIKSIFSGDCCFITNPNAKTLTKTRYVELRTNHMFCRIDSQTSVPRINKKVLKNIPFSDFDTIVISDYNKGFLTLDDIEFIGKSHPLVWLDTKKILDSWAESVTFIKINRKEYEDSKKFLNKRIESKIIKTLGSEGCSYNGQIFPVKPVEIKNLSGAGDTFLAGLVVKYLETGNIKNALKYANKLATIVVQKIGVATVND